MHTLKLSAHSETINAHSENLHMNAHSETECVNACSYIPKVHQQSGLASAKFS